MLCCVVCCVLCVVCCVLFLFGFLPSSRFYKYRHVQWLSDFGYLQTLYPENTQKKNYNTKKKMSAANKEDENFTSRALAGDVENLWGNGATFSLVCFCSSFEAHARIHPQVHPHTSIHPPAHSCMCRIICEGSHEIHLCLFFTIQRTTTLACFIFEMIIF